MCLWTLVIATLLVFRVVSVMVVVVVDVVAGVQRTTILAAYLVVSFFWTCASDQMAVRAAPISKPSPKHLISIYDLVILVFVMKSNSSFRLKGNLVGRVLIASNRL